MSEENGLLSQAPDSEPPLRGEQPVARHRGRDAHTASRVHAGSGQAESRMHGDGRGAPRRTGRGGRSAGAGVRLAVRAAHAAERTEVTSEIRRFADRSLRAVLEVLDRRRQVEQLAGIADPLVLAAVRTLVSADQAPERALGSAVLVRIDVRLVAADTAELCAGYSRGERRFALAARAVRRRANGWQLTALRVR